MEADINSGRGHPLVMPEAGRIDHRSMRLEYDLPPIFKRRHPGAARMMDQLHYGMRVHRKVSARASPPPAHKTQGYLAGQGDSLLRSAGKWGGDPGFHIRQRSGDIFFQQPESGINSRFLAVVKMQKTSMLLEL